MPLPNRAAKKISPSSPPTHPNTTNPIARPNKIHKKSTNKSRSNKVPIKISRTPEIPSYGPLSPPLRRNKFTMLIQLATIKSISLSRISKMAAGWTSSSACNLSVMKKSGQGGTREVKDQQNLSGVRAGEARNAATSQKPAQTHLKGNEGEEEVYRWKDRLARWHPQGLQGREAGEVGHQGHLQAGEASQKRAEQEVQAAWAGWNQQHNELQRNFWAFQEGKKLIRQ